MGAFNRIRNLLKYTLDPWSCSGCGRKTTNQNLCRRTQSTRNRPSPRPPPEMAPVSCGCSHYFHCGWSPCHLPSLHSSPLPCFPILLRLVSFCSATCFVFGRISKWDHIMAGLGRVTELLLSTGPWQMLTGLCPPTLPDPPSFPTKATLPEFQRPRALLDGIHYHPYNDSQSRGSKDATPPDCTYLYKL